MVIKIDLDLYKDELNTEYQRQNFLNFILRGSYEIFDFSYTKKDGTIRKARGTLNVDLIKELLSPDEFIKFKTIFDEVFNDGNTILAFQDNALNGYCLYFDTECMNIRQFKPSLLNKVEKPKKNIMFE
jgi:hypothetical protein